MLKERLGEYTNVINEALDKYIEVNKDYDEELKKAMKYSLMAGGKRLRPALILEGYRLFKPNYL